MNGSTRALVVSLGLCLTMACGDDGGDSESIEALCQRACATAATVACPSQGASTCASDCADAEAIPEPCRSVTRAALECAVERPSSEWTCAEDGMAVLNDVCGAEGRALLVCVVENTGDGTCPYENDAECDDPTGTALCRAGTDVPDCS